MNYRTSFSIPFVMGLLILSTAVHSQTYFGKDAEKFITGAKEIRFNQDNGSVSFVSMNEFSNISEESHLEWLKHVLKTDNSYTFLLLNNETDKLNYKHFRYQEYYHGLKVEYGRYYVHIKNGKVESANGEFYPAINVLTQPSTTKESALQTAMSHSGSKNMKFNKEKMLSDAEVLILPFEKKYFLAYRFDLYSLSPLRRVYIYIDATTGNYITEVNRIHTADVTGIASTAYNGNVNLITDSVSSSNYRLQAQMGFNGIKTRNCHNNTNFASATDFTDADNNWNTSGIDRYATDAHYGLQATYDWYHTRFGRNSFDNAGAMIECYVHYDASFVNAFWDGTEIAFGDGDGVDYTPLTCLDIVGHELTHAVTENTAALVYSGESGALNEGYSDCMGVTIDFYKHPTTANFLEGDQVNVNGIPARNMGDPNQYQCPDTYLGNFWDFGGEVHTNSGVMNFWYYLICQGGSGTNDLGNLYTVNSIGLTKASEIAYRALTVYLTPNSNYNDMRTATVQSATDLYGSCSNEVVQVANAWYAVGVGSIFSNSVIAGFISDVNYVCSLPGIIHFTSTSLNASTYLWNFGDGTTSTTQNPIHSYAVAGTYSVSLIVSGSASCSSGDTMQQPNFVTVVNGGGPITASCQPVTSSNCCGVGIFNVTFNTINNTTIDGSEGYKDFTCGLGTTLTAGDPVMLSVRTGTNYNENVRSWIDYDNNGTFNNVSELVFISDNKLVSHTGIVHTNASAILNTPLRMRVMDDNSSSTISGSCYNPYEGQAEDYTVTFTANTQRPTADFTADAFIVSIGSSVHFSDMSVHVPTSWLWTFQGGTPTTSTLQNPTVSYNTLGTYQVKLRVTNSFGTDSITKTAYINVVNSINLCSGTSIATAANGQFYDSGGSAGSYSTNENCSLLISPQCSQSITMIFTQFMSESCCDHLYIYDGDNSMAPIIASLGGSPSLSPITANSGKMFIVWHSDGSSVYPGWQASWTAVIGSMQQCVAAFSPSTSNPPLNVNVQFTDNTTNSPLTWSWTFGDGATSASQNPVHAYVSPGSYTVNLIAANCSTSDTITHVVTVQTAPVMSINPDTVNITLSCNDSTSVPVTISNTGTGDGVFYVPGSVNSVDTVHVLAFMEGADQSQEYPNTISSINTYFSKFTITQFNSTDSASLRIALNNIDVLLFPEQESGATSFYQSLGQVVRDFANAGGKVIVIGSTIGYENRMYEMGLFNGNYIGYTSTSYVYVLDTTNELTHYCALSFPSPNVTIYHNITDTDAVVLAQCNSGDVLAYRPMGAGKVVYLGFDYYSTDSSMQHMIANAISSTQQNTNSVIVINPATDTIAPGGNQPVQVSVNSSGMNAGTYQDVIGVHTNDPAHPLINLLINVTVTGSPSISLSDSCLHFGTVMEHTTTYDTLRVNNDGCDTLTISSLTSGNPAFIVPSVFSIPPFSYVDVPIAFNPTSIGSYNGTITILNNSIDTSICVNGNAVAAPVMVVTPHSITTSLNPCNDSITIPVYVRNDGGADLQFNMQGGSGDDSTHILAYIFGTDMSTEYPNTITAIQTNYSKFRVDTTSTMNASTLQSLLTGKDVLLFPEQELGSTSQYSTFSTVVQNFVANGGTVVLLGSDFNPSQIYNLGLFSGNYVTYTNSGTGTVLVPTDDLMDGIPSSISLTNSTMYHNITNIDKVMLISYTGRDVVTYRNIGSGKAIYAGWDFFNYNNYTQKIVSNCIKYAGTSYLPPWVSLSSAVDTVSSGDSVLVNVTLHSVDLSAGTYTTYIIIQSNDPLHLIDSIPVVVTVGSNPCAKIGYNAFSTCTGIVSFVDSSKNSPTSWAWDFGDGTTSNVKNPVHSYSASGLYTVSLKVCSVNGCDSVTRNLNISSVNGPIIPVCQSPNTISYCCGVGITHVTFNSINKTSYNGSMGYEDFTCTQNTTVVQGQTYTLNVTTGLSYYENTNAWIDYNGDGMFSNAEQVMTSWSVLTNHSTSVIIPNLTVINTPLRMRISTDNYIYTTPTACNDVQEGQVEDYTVVISPNNLPPDARISYHLTSACSGQILFVDTSYNNPSSWSWNFGDGQTSSLQNPVHIYSSSGTYVVKLIATNSYGIDSVTTSVSVNVIASGVNVTGSLMILQPLQFSVTGTGLINYMWDFGDGYLATLANPMHIYNTPGTYLVSVTISNGFCSATLIDTLRIGPVGIEEPGGLSNLKIYPNPFRDEVNISYVLQNTEKVSIQMYDVLGRTVFNSDEKYEISGEHTYTIKNLNESMYFMRMTIDKRNVVFKLLKL